MPLSLRTTAFALATLALALAGPASANTEFLIVPIPQPPEVVVQQPGNVVTVATNGAEFTDLRAALDSIDDAGPDNRYIVYLGPGTFTLDQTLQMKPYVSLVGSGRDQTFVVGQVSSSAIAQSSLVRGADHAALQHMTVRNDGGGFYAFGITNENASPTLHDLDVFAFGGQVNRAIHNFGYAAPRISRVYAEARFGFEATAIRDGGYLGATIVDTRAVAEGATGRNVGIEVSASTTIRQTEASALGGSERCRGIWLTSNDADIESVTASATGNRDCFGFYAVEADAPQPVRYSTLSGQGGALVDGEAQLSTIVDGQDGSLGETCVNCADQHGNPLDDRCGVIAMP
jgi:hypothetical protein